MRARENLIMATASGLKKRSFNVAFKLMVVELAGKLPPPFWHHVLMETKVILTPLQILTTKRMTTSLLATRLSLKTVQLCTA